MKRREATKAEGWLFGTANLGNNTYFMIITMFMMFFFTNVMGLKPMVAGTIFMVARLVDALTDPIMGFIVDHTNFKHFGKYRGYVQIGAPFLGVVFVMLFTVPDLGMGGKVIYAYLVYILYSLVWTVVQIPIVTFPIIMSQNTARRTKLVAIFQGFGGIVGALCTAVIYKLLDVFGGMTSGDAWQKTAICVAVFATIMQEIAMIAVRKLDVYDPGLKQRKEAQRVRQGSVKVPLKDRVAVITKNVALFALVISFGTDMFANQVNSNTTTYFFLYNLNGRTDLQSILGVVNLPVIFILMFTAGAIAGRFGKKKVILFCEVICIGCNALMLLSGGTNIVIVMLTGIIGTVMFTVTNMMCRSALMDVACYTRIKHGQDVAGLMSSSFTFVNKLVQAFGSFFTGWLLELVAFDATAQVQSEGTLTGLLVMRTVIPILAQVATLIAMHWYPISKPVEDEISVGVKTGNEAQDALPENVCPEEA